MRFLILCLLILVSFNTKGQNKEGGETASDSIFNKRLEQLNFNSDSLQSRLIQIQKTLDSLETKDDSLFHLILNGPKITSFEQYRFENWLKVYNLSSVKFNDSVVVDVFELWSYKKFTDKMSKNYFVIPSKDSSFILLTNFNRNNTTIKGDLYFKFLEPRTKKVYNGITLFKEREFDILDYFWFDNKTLFILKKYKGEHYQLIKLRGKINQIYFYNT